MCTNLASDQEKLKIKGHPIENSEAASLSMVCSKEERLSLKQERVDQGLPYQSVTLMGRSHGKGATASIINTNVDNMAGLDEWFNK